MVGVRGSVSTVWKSVMRVPVSITDFVRGLLRRRRARLGKKRKASSRCRLGHKFSIRVTCYLKRRES